MGRSTDRPVEVDSWDVQEYVDYVDWVASDKVEVISISWLSVSHTLPHNTLCACLLRWRIQLEVSQDLEIYT